MRCHHPGQVLQTGGRRRGRRTAGADHQRHRAAQADQSAGTKTLIETLSKTQRIVAQSGQRKAVDGQRKLYAWHASEVDWISKGKAKHPYEFGVRVGIASTPKGNLIAGARAFHGNTYDRHILNELLEQTAILMQYGSIKPLIAFVDLGYRGVGPRNPQVQIVHRGKS